MMHGFTPVKGIFRKLHINPSARNRAILRTVLTERGVESHTGEKSKRLWFRTSALKEHLPEIVEKIKAEAKKPDAVGVPHAGYTKRTRRRRVAKANGVDREANPVVRPSDKGMLIALPQGKNKTLLFTLEEARDIYKWLGKLFAGE
jgi:hypothetical protein